MSEEKIMSPKCKKILVEVIRHLAKDCGTWKGLARASERPSIFKIHKLPEFARKQSEKDRKLLKKLRGVI